MNQLDRLDQLERLLRSRQSLGRDALLQDCKALVPLRLATQFA